MTPETHPPPESTGIAQLEQILGGLFIGDNVIWYDDAGSLASVFCQNLIQAAVDRREPVIYVSFDRSPKNLFDKLGALAAYPALTVLDCFTHGKGAGADVFLKFFKTPKTVAHKRVICVEDPHQTESFSDALYRLVDDARGGVRLVFESLTGMQAVWGGEEQVIRFYSRACPRLYELNTIAYWLIEKGVHSPRLKSSINQIAQVVFDLTVKRGKTLMTILKAEKQATAPLNKPLVYLTRDMDVRFESQDRASGPYALGDRLKARRRALPCVVGTVLALWLVIVIRRRARDRWWSRWCGDEDRASIGRLCGASPGSETDAGGREEPSTDAGSIVDHAGSRRKTESERVQPACRGGVSPGANSRGCRRETA